MMVLPDKPDFLKVRNPPRSPLQPLRSAAKRVVINVLERGWFGAIPLETHVVMAGFPRSGSTLLQLMVESAYRSAKTFQREQPALGVAHNMWPGTHALIITKRPNDIFWFQELREAYARRRARVRFVVTVRDPRAVLTSFHVQGAGYWVSCERWRAVDQHVQFQRQFDDVLTLDFKEIVGAVDQTEKRFVAFIGHPPQGRFSDYQKNVPEGFVSDALNGLRPPDPDAAEKWRHPKHRDRLRECLREVPELPRRLVELGYEPDERWVEDYR